MPSLRHLIAMTAIMFVTAPGMATAKQPPPTPQQPMRPITRCIDLTRIDEWHVIDARTLTVRNGPFRYVVKTRYDCPRLGRYGAGLRFRVSPDKRALGLPRICGDVGDEVASRDQPPCAIASVRNVDKAEFDRLDRHAQRSGSGAEQVTAPPHH